MVVVYIVSELCSWNHALYVYVVRSDMVEGVRHSTPSNPFPRTSYVYEHFKISLLKINGNFALYFFKLN